MEPGSAGPRQAALTAPPYPALTIAKWLIAQAQAQAAELPGKKLQKMLGYAQARYLAEHGGPLFAERVQAWSGGPAVPAVHRAYRKFGNSAIRLDDCDPFRPDDVDPATAEFLRGVWAAGSGGDDRGRSRLVARSVLILIALGIGLAVVALIFA